MSFAFGRKKLSCFGCGKASSQTWNGRAQMWRCASCDAENYLDSNGNLTDPPYQKTTAPTPSIRYARPAPHAAEDLRPSDEIFCQTCLKNQLIVKESLASYGSKEDAVDHTTFTKAYNSYRKHLESRYPPVCQRCVPKVREQMRKASYAAKTDHLRRMIDRTKTGNLVNTEQKLFQSWIFCAIGWFSRGSALAQVIRHIIAVVSSYPDIALPKVIKLRGRTLEMFPTKSFVGRESILGNEEAQDLSPWMPWPLFIFALTIWWNPQLQAKLHLPSARLQGLAHYYTLQVICLIVMAAGDYYLSHPSTLLSVEMARGINAFMAVFIFACQFISSRTTHIATKPLFTFPDHDEPILPEVAEHRETQNQSNAYAQTTPSKDRTPFPISKLGPTQTVNMADIRPPTPPEIEDDPDSMDWTPTAKPSPMAFQPQPRPQKPPSAFQDPSPFHGTLPAAPVPPSHKLRNPTSYQPGTFRKATAAQQSSFAADISQPVRRSARVANRAGASGYDSDGTELTTEDDATSVAESEIAPGRIKKRDMEMRQPRFFASQDQADTGLEEMFGGSFGLLDTPPGAAATADGNTLNKGWFGWNRRSAKTK